MMVPILPFNSSETTLEVAGGKGTNLGRLSRSGFPVPRGFIIATAAYRQFIAHNGLDTAIEAALAALDDPGARVDGHGEGAASPAALQAASEAIRAAFAQGSMPAGLRDEIVQAYAGLQAQASERQPRSREGAHRFAVAVRSSATAEDLPDLSFAGQQDTYLNVTGEEQLLEAVVNCWSSLWTARAIGYRQRNAIAQSDAALAVVVQEMVPSDCSGVLFTANPLSGLLGETVIDATFGLGEALVSGQVEPDHYVYDVRSDRLLHQTLGAKQVATRARPEGGVENVPADGEQGPALTEDEVRELALLGQRIQAEYGAPQDIEWAIAGGKVTVLQSRAITSLFPVPEVSFDPLEVWLSFGSVQGVMGPITPLGRDTLQHVLTGAGRLFNRRLKPGELSVFDVAGERIWIRLSDLLRHPLGVRIYPHVASLIEPSMAQIMAGLAGDPHLHLGQGKRSLRTYQRIVAFGAPLLVRAARNILRPQQARARFDRAVEQYLAAAQVAPGGDRFERLANVVAYVREQLMGVFPFLLPRFLTIFAPSMAAFVALRRMAGSDQQELVLEITRGLPGNVTTEMDLALWAAAKTIRADTDALRLFEATPAAELACLALDGALPPKAQAVVDDFLARYGMRGVGEIDLARPRWREDPTPVIHSLKSYLQIAPEQAPDALFARGAASAQAAIEQLAGIVRRQRGGRLKAKVVRFLARRLRMFMGSRESPKFFAIRVMGTARAALLEVGQAFVEDGTIERSDDLFFLTVAELDSLAGGEESGWRRLVAERRAVYAREQRRRQVPRVLVSDGRAFYEGVGAQTDSASGLSGSPVSPGVAEGPVHIILDPRGAQLAPGEILVCPGTDPAWTPLFMAAGGLITEVGGMMTHGSVVAREVGIPAVVGVHMATQRLKNGQRIRMDGSTGEIVVLD
jgi:pyruvate,water dikinase